MGRRVLFCVVCLLVIGTGVSTSLFAATVVLKSGRKVEGRIVDRTDSYVKVDFQGIPLTFFLDEISTIDGRPVAASPKTHSRPSFVTKAPQDIFKNVSPAVVYIVTQTVGGQQYLGSGFIIDAQGVIITNFHVIKSAQEIGVKLRDGRIFPVTGVIHYDPSRDFCIFKIEARDLPEVVLGDSDTVQIGETAYCVGNPLGLEYSFSDGMLSGERNFKNLRYLQFTAPVSPGNSGGPLLNCRGEVVGIVTFLMEGGQNLNFALAVNEIKPFLRVTPEMSFSEFVKKVSLADYYINQAFKCMLANDLNQALAQFQKALEVNPNSFEANDYIAGLLGSYLHRPQDALPYLEKAIQIDPNRAEVYNDFGAVYYLLGRIEEAMPYYEKAIRMNPAESMYYSNMGQACYELGKYQQALPYLEKAVQLAPVYDAAYYYLGKLYIKLNQPPQYALFCFEEYLKLRPDCGETWHLRGCILLDLGQRTTAKESLLKAKELFSAQKEYEKLKVVDDLIREQSL